MMFRPAVVATVLATMIVIGFLVSAVTAWRPPSPSEYAVHSYSGRTVGFRGLYETFEALHVPVSRSWATPPALFHGDKRVLLLQPDLYFMEREKSYLEDLARWLREGGEAVVVTRDLSFLEDNPRFGDDEERRSRAEKVFGADRLAYALGVEGLRVEPVFHYSENDSSSEPATPGGLIRIAAPPELEYEPSFEGTFEKLADSVSTLMLPDERLRWFEGEAVERAVGAVRVEATSGEEVPIALEFKQGLGRVVLVSEPTLFNNLGLGEGDNAVLAYRLAVGAGDRPLVFDEYYHGALAGLGATALLSVFPYGAVVAFVLLATLIWAWSNGVRFGPPLDAPPESRRNILEYVDAMARLFRRGQKRAFVLRTNREGLLDEIRRELRLPGGSPSDIVRKRLAQTDEARGRRLDDVLNEVDRVLVAGQPVSETELHHFQERLETCRTLKAPNPAPKPSPEPTAS